MDTPLMPCQKQQRDDYYYRLFRKLVIFALLATITLGFMTVFILRPTLRGDEALYWDMSRNLALGYASKPPAIAYVLRATTTIFGNEEWAIRLPAIFLMIFFVFCVHKTSSTIFNTSLAGWITIYILLFDFQYLGNIRNITTNNLLYLFWVLSILCYWRALQGKNNYWIGLGFTLGLGFLSKYSIMFLVLSLLLHMSLFKPGLWLQKGIWKTIFIALIINIGVIYWNLQYSLLSFTHTMRILENSQTTAWYEFIFGQIGSLGPVAFIAYTCILFLMIYKVRSFPGKNILLFSTIIPILFYYALSLTRSLYPHWIYPGWLGAMIGCGYFALLVLRYWPGHKRLIYRSFLVLFSLHILLMTCFAVLILLGQVPSDNNPFKYKWPAIWHTHLQDYNAVNPFVFSTNYSSSARLAYYTPGRPRTYCIEMLMQQEPNQYDVWGGWESLIGRDGWLVEVQEPEVVLGFASELVEGHVFSSYKLVEAVEGEKSHAILEPESLPITVVLMKNYLGKTPAQFIQERNKTIQKTKQSTVNIQRLAKVAQEVAEHIPHSPKAQKRCADLMLVAGDKQMALHYFERALELEEDSEVQLNLLEKTAQLYFETGNTDKAVEGFARLLQQQPQNSAAIEGLADIAFHLEDYGKAEEYFLLLGKIEDSKVEKAAEFLLRIGKYWQQQKKYEDAQRVFMAAATYSPQHAIAWLYLGDIEKEKRQYASAILSYSQFMYKEPESYEGAARINNLLDVLGEPSQAITTWTKISQQIPHAVLPHIHLGLALEQENRFSEAANTFKIAADNSDTPDKAHIYAATTLVLANNIEEGLALLRSTLKISPDLLSFALEHLIQTGPTFIGANRLDEFMQLCTIVVAYVNNQENVFHLASLLAKNGAYNHAEKLYCSLLEKPVLQGKAAVKLDRLLQQQKSPDYRFKTWERLREELPDMPVIKERLAIALFDVGNYIESKTIFRTLINTGCLETDGQLRLAILESLSIADNAENKTPLIHFVREHPETKETVCHLVTTVCNTLRQRNELNKTYALMEQLVHIAPEREDSWLLMGGIYRQTGNQDKALETYKNGIQKAQEAFRIANELEALLEFFGQGLSKLDTWQSIIQLAPESVAAQLHYANALAAGDSLEVALEIYRKIMNDASEHHEIRIQYGLALIKVGRQESGFDEISIAVTEAPSLNVMAANACMEAGNYLTLKEEYATAVTAFETALHYVPDAPLIKLKLLETLCKYGEYDNALTALIELISKEDDISFVTEALCIWETCTNVHETPEQKVKRWRQLHEKMPGSYPVLEQYALAVAQSGNFDKARNLCEKYNSASTDSLICTALKACSGDINSANTLYDLAVSWETTVSDAVVEIINQIASTLKEKEQYEACRRVLLSLEVLQPGNLWHQVHLGEVLAEEECYREALERFRSVLFLAPESSYTAALLDSVYQSLNLPEKHVAEWQGLVELNPGAFIPLEHLKKAQEATSVAAD